MFYNFLVLLDWALISASIYNTIILLWLGLTVLLNAENRTWGVVMAGAGLLLGGSFFAGHTAVVGQMSSAFSGQMTFYWRLGWLILIIMPYVWYLVMAWYTGAVRQPGERYLLIGMGILGCIAIMIALFIDPLPSYEELSNPRGSSRLGGVTIARLIYPSFATLCITLALSVLRKPTASDRFMGDLARQRAKPWLIFASIGLIIISLAIGVGSIWFFDQARSGLFPGLTAQGIGLLIIFDFIVCILIGIVITLIGQAVVAYEIFTGKALPRGELARQWRRILILACGYGLVVGWSLSTIGIPTQPIYQLLLATVLMTLFIALVGWRQASEQRNGISRLRPFVSSQHLYDQLLGPNAPTPAEPTDTFRALCGELLGAKLAYLLPSGSLADLVGPPLAFPHQAASPLQTGNILAEELAKRPLNQTPLCLPLEPEQYAGAVWAVPLYNDQGLIGLLLLGEKQDGGVYTQEEVEVAQATSERLIDAQAAAEMARRLVAIQRRRLAESQVLDRRTRRVLHDEVLPQIHATVLQIASYRHQSDSGQGALAAGNSFHELGSALQSQLGDIHRQISDLLHDLPTALGPDLARLGPLGALRRAIEGDLGAAFDSFQWRVPSEVEQQAQQLDPLVAEALYYAAREAVRNAARHGRGKQAERRLNLIIQAQSLDKGGKPQIELIIEDDGVGPNPQAQSESEGGHGLVLHSTLLAIMSGTMQITRTPEQTTRVTILLPLGQS